MKWCNDPGTIGLVMSHIALTNHTSLFIHDKNGRNLYASCHFHAVIIESLYKEQNDLLVRTISKHIHHNIQV